MAFFSANPGFDPNQYANNGEQGLTEGQQQQFAQALSAQAAGQGPSAATMMLKQQADQNNAAMAAQAASARGVNPALASRNAELAGAQVQQQANAEAATTRAQEQLAAEGLLGTTLAQKRQQDIINSNDYNNLAAGYNKQSSADTGTLLGGIYNSAGAALPYLGKALNFFTGAPATGAANAAGSVVAAPGSTDWSDVGNDYSSVGNGFGEGSSANTGSEGVSAATGGMITRKGLKMADGGEVPPNPQFYTPTWVPPTGPTTTSTMVGGRDVNGIQVGGTPQTQVNPGAPGYTMPAQGPISPLYNPGGASLRSAGVPALTAPAIANPTPSGTNPSDLMGLVNQAKAGVNGAAQAATAQTQQPYHVMMAKGGPISHIGQHYAKVKALVSPGERYLSPQAVKEVASGKKSPMSAGTKIPGKAVVSGAKNSYANDTVPKTLAEGGIVIPRSITQGANAEKRAHEFVSAILAKNKGFRK